ncbi:sister chromatid cohesion protein Dcc1 [Scheffersomyces coipomensis]|uniref:sister chromatid cohesion protein Dcc1 n=1 Tax=Scheffersomyces coipomensis TaxID=1788519 RepID=UPI00315C6B7E
MVSYSVYQQITNDPEHTYKLMQLPPDLLEYITNNDKEELVLKSSITSDNLVVCSNSKTWRLRQMNHSNTALICDNLNINVNNKFTDPLVETGDQQQQFDNKLVGFSQCSYEYELSSTEGIIDITDLPRHSGDQLSDDTLNVDTLDWSLQQLIDNSPISSQEFFTKWYEYGGCIINDKVHILTNEFITEILYGCITILISENINYNDDIEILNFIQLILMQDETMNQSIMETIIHKFGHEIKEDTFKLDHAKISKWFGIQQLAKSSGNLINKKEFLLHWKSSLPSFYNVSLDIQDLRGNYCSPIEDKILYVNASDLATSNLSVRFVQLFQLDKNWNYDDFIPFIADFVPNGKKVDSVILKYARKKKITKDKYLIVPR